MSIRSTITFYSVSRANCKRIAVPSSLRFPLYISFYRITVYEKLALIKYS